MQRQVGTEPRDDGLTSGSDSRPSRDLTEPLVLDVAAEAQTLFDEREWGERDRNSRTISSTPQMRVTLTALRGGAELGSEGSDDTLAVHVLRGSVELEFAGRTETLGEGQLATVPEPGRWRVRAAGDALLLLTVAQGRAAAGAG